ncbi:MAG: hypothetical protein ABR527_09160 [Gemmatimonadota bacterium]
MDRLKVWTKASAWIVFALSIAALACNSEDEEITGTYGVFVFESEDTCDDVENSYNLLIEITRQGDGFSVLINGSGPLTGDFRDDGILAVTGTITETDGTRPRQALFEMDIQRGRIVEGAARITWNGTFPDVPGVCVQDLDFTGSRQDAAVPIVG